MSLALALKAFVFLMVVYLAWVGADRLWGRK